MGRETGAVLIIVGVWLIVASLAGGLADRIIAAAPVSPAVAGQGGATLPGGGAGGGGGGGGAW